MFFSEVVAILMLIDETYIAEHFGVNPPATLKKSKERGCGNASFSDESLKASSAEEAFAKIECWVTVRERSVKEVRTRLLDGGYSEETTQDALDRALTCGYLDDARFADVLIRCRLQAGKGMMGVRRELASADIDCDALEGFPDYYLDMIGDQAQAAYELLLKKPPRAKNKLQAAYAKLIRSGYSSDDASTAARRWVEAQQF